MRVEERMTKNITSCAATDDLDTAASLLWQNDLGCMPVVDGSGHVQGMITDRDICMAAFTTGKRLAELRVGDTMAKNVASTSPTDSLQTAEMVMRGRMVHRLPVVDGENRVVGMLCTNDLLRWVDDGGANGSTDPGALHLVRTLATVGRPRTAPAVRAILGSEQPGKGRRAATQHPCERSGKR